MISGASTAIWLINQGVAYLGSKKKEQKLEPISTILRLALLSQMPIGTKLSIKHQSIAFHTPSVVQSEIRRFNGVGRDDLGFLQNPIQNGCKLWLADKNENLRYIYLQAIHGIRNLQQTYIDKQDTTNGCLNSYILMIEEALKSYNIVTHVDALNPVDIKIKNVWDANQIMAAKTLLENNMSDALINMLLEKDKAYQEVLKNLLP